MAEGNKYGFGGIGASGGIANLVAAPKVNQVRGMQFAPTPRLPVKSKKDNKKQLLGALLGSASPFLADVALEGLDKVGLPGLFEDDPLALQAQKSSLNSPVGEDGKTIPVNTLSQGSPEQIRQNIIRRRAEEINRASPNITAKRKTGLGQLLSRGLEFAPAFAFAGDEADGSSEAFINSSNAARKLTAAMDASESDAAIRRAQSRSAEFAKLDPKLTETTVHSFYKPDPERDYFKNYQTSALRDEFGVTWVLSNGVAGLDVDQNGATVKKGTYYRNPRMTILDGDSAEVDSKPFQDVDNPSIIYQGRIEKVFNPETGGETVQTTFQDPEDLNKRVTLEELRVRGFNLISNLDRYEQRPYPKSKETPIQKKLTEDAVKMAALNALGLTSQAVLDPLMENVQMVPDKDGNLIPTNFNNGITSAVPKLLGRTVDAVQRNVINFGEQLNQLGITDSKGVTAVDTYNYNLFKGEDGNIRREATTAAALVGATSQFQAVWDDGNASDAEKKAASRNLSMALGRLRESSVEQGADLTGWLSLDQPALEKYLNKQGLFAANQIRLAYMAAAAQGEKGRSLSDKDISFFMNTLGFNSGRAETVARNVGQFVYQQIIGFDQNEDKAAETRRLAQLDKEPIEEQEMFLRGLNSRFAGKFNISKSILEELRRETDPKKRTELRFAVEDKLNEVTNGMGGRVYGFDAKNQVFVRKTLASDFRNDILLKNLNKYLDQLGYNITTGEDALYPSEATPPAAAGTPPVTGTPAAVTQTRARLLDKKKVTTATGATP